MVNVQVDDSTTNSKPYYLVRAGLDTKARSVNVHLALTVPSHFLEDGSLTFLFASDAEVSLLYGEQLIEYEIKEAGLGVSIYKLQFGNTSDVFVAVEMVYSLVLSNDHQVNRITENWVELNIDSFWHPVLTSFSRFHFRLVTDLDESYHILGGDRIIASPENVGKRIIESIIPRIDISFSASKQFYNRESRYSRVYSTNKATDLDSLLHLSEHALVFLEDYIERPEDFIEKRIVVESPREDVGYARENYVVLSKLDGMDPKSLSRFLAHEFSHYWFLHANPQTQNHWLNESFAEFLAIIYIRDTYGETAYLDEIEYKLERIKSDPRILASQQGRPSHIAMYYTGPIILHHFEEYVGYDRFRSLIQQMIRGRISTNEELFILIRNHLGAEAEEKLISLLNTQFH